MIKISQQSFCYNSYVGDVYWTYISYGFFYEIDSGVTQNSPDGFGWPKCFCGRVKFPKYVCLVGRLGEQLFETQSLKIILDILW